MEGWGLFKLAHRLALNFCFPCRNNHNYIRFGSQEQVEFATMSELEDRAWGLALVFSYTSKGVRVFQDRWQEGNIRDIRSRHGHRFVRGMVAAYKHTAKVLRDLLATKRGSGVRAARGPGGADQSDVRKGKGRSKEEVAERKAERAGSRPIKVSSLLVRGFQVRRAARSAAPPATSPSPLRADSSHPDFHPKVGVFNRIFDRLLNPMSSWPRRELIKPMARYKDGKHVYNNQVQMTYQGPYRLALYTQAFLVESDRPFEREGENTWRFEKTPIMGCVGY